MEKTTEGKETYRFQRKHSLPRLSRTYLKPGRLDETPLTTHLSLDS